MDDRQVEPAAPQPVVAPGPDKPAKVICFVSKKEIDQSAARQLRHPKEGLVWVGVEFIR